MLFDEKLYFPFIRFLSLIKYTQNPKNQSHSHALSISSSPLSPPPPMAARSLPSLRHSHHSLLHRHQPEISPTALSSSLFLKPATPIATVASSLSSTAAAAAASFSLSAATSSSTPDTSSTVSFDELQLHLSARNFRQADEETRRLLIALAGEAAQKRGYVYFSEVQFISADDLRAIDDLWQEHSDGKFGYSVQKRIFEKVNRDFTKLFMKIGWMKKLDTEMEQYNYRSFPTEFVWELTEETPEGHLPLTNALRGTQLMSNILSHPAFDAMGEEEADEENDNGGLKKGLKSMSERIFKSDYSF